MYDRIPEELKKIDRWVCWRIEDRDGKPTKVPINPLTGGRAMSNNPATWSCFQDAVNHQFDTGRNGIKSKGIGFMFNSDGIIGVDLDHCRDENGNLKEEARDIIQTLDSYTEFSQSKQGIHIICYGKMPEGRKRKDNEGINVEMYASGRFFIMTGDTLDDAHMDVEDRTQELEIVHKKYLAEKVKNKSKAPVITYELDMDDKTLIDKAMSAENGSRFRNLYNGDTSGNGKDDSAADLAFCNILAFWTRCNVSQMDRIFRQSGLMRSKWDEMHGADTYGNITIQKAISDCSKVYEPKINKNESANVPDINNGLDALAASFSALEKERSLESQEEKTKEIYDPTTDLGRSKIFSNKYKDTLRWCDENGYWYIWNGKVWESDKKLKILQMAKETIGEIVQKTFKSIKYAKNDAQLEKAKEKYKIVLKAQGERPIKAMISLSKSDLPITLDQMDNDPFLLNCLNGVVDLKTGKLTDHKPEYYMSKIANAEYTPKKQFKHFKQFLDDITCEDVELSNYFQQVCGMSAIGKVFHEGMCIFYGSGRNGKSTFLNLISRIFGDYSCQINTETLMAQRDGKQIIGGVSVEGKRFATAMETEEGRRLSGAMLKKLASADKVSERPMYAAERTFEPSHTLIMACNFLPKIGSTDTGTWRRIAVVPFKAKFEEGKKEIKDYAGILFKEDANAILAWIVEGAVKYYKNGFTIKTPQVIKDATKQYRAAEDWIGNFIAECCEIGEFEEMGGTLYDAYVVWCDKNNESYKRRPRDFAAALEAANFTKRHGMKGSIWKGLKLQDGSQKNYNYYKQSQMDEDGLDAPTRLKM